jgi:hypothetical protein
MHIYWLMSIIDSDTTSVMGKLSLLVTCFNLYLEHLVLKKNKEYVPAIKRKYADYPHECRNIG